MLGKKLMAIFKANRKTYGAPRLKIALGKQGIWCGKKRIARLQRRFGLHPVQRSDFARAPRKAILACPWPKTNWPKFPLPNARIRFGSRSFDGFAALWAAFGSLSALRSSSYIPTKECLPLPRRSFGPVFAQGGGVENFRLAGHGECGACLAKNGVITHCG